MPWTVVRDCLKRNSLLRRLAGKRDPFEFYQYVYTPAAYRRILKACGFNVLSLRPYGGPPPGWVERFLSKLDPQHAAFYSAHMTMAIAQPACWERAPSGQQAAV